GGVIGGALVLAPMSNHLPAASGLRFRESSTSNRGSTADERAARVIPSLSSQRPPALLRQQLDDGRADAQAGRPVKHAAALGVGSPEPLIDARISYPSGDTLSDTHIADGR